MVTEKAAGYRGPPTGQTWTPVPYPTALTDAAIGRATEQFRRELDALREVLSQRIGQGIEARDVGIANLRETIGARLDAMDRATQVLEQTVNRTPTLLQTAIANVKEVYDERFLSLRQQLTDRTMTYDEKFASIQLQFIERDVRTEQAATASASALAAALQAAKEAVFEQSQAASRAAEKTELSFTKQIDQIQLQIKTIGDAFSDKIDDLKGRIDRGEGSETGAGRQRSETRLNMGAVISISLLVVAVLSLIVLYATKK
jgi:hypothetical protein